MKNPELKFIYLLVFTVLSLISQAQSNCGFVLDKFDHINKLKRLLNLLETDKYSTYMEASQIPKWLFDYMGCEKESKFMIANPSEEWRCCCTSSEDLPGTQLVFISISADVVLIQYLTGGFGVSSVVTAFILKGDQIVEIWKGYGDKFLKSNVDVVTYTRRNQGTIRDPEWEHWIISKR